MADKASVSVGAVPPTQNRYLDTLIQGNHWNDDHPVTFYFEDNSADQRAWTEAEKDAFREALATYENYIDIEFEEVDNRADANLVLTLDTLEDINATARFEYPGSDAESVGQFPYDWERWTDWHLQKGGYAHLLVLHELGHGLGLVHPHPDEDTGLNGLPFPGVTSSGDTGDDGLNSAIYTVMSYNDRGQFWAPDNPPSSDYGWGFVATPMAFDVAALQHIYGANMSYKTGNDVYTLPDTNGDGTYWSLIWDAGGIDRIRHTGSADAVIDLREAPLVGPNAGGYLSQVEGVFGGFVIANGVTIEYAEGGSGDDIITGNAADNEIAGNAGNDALFGLAGNDLMDGGAGNDHLNGGLGIDTLVGGTGDDTFVIDSPSDVLHEGVNGGIDEVVSSISYTLGAHFENLSLAESPHNSIDGTGNGLDNKIIGNSDSNTLEGRAGDDFLSGGGGGDHIDGGTGEDTIYGGQGNDFLDGGDDELFDFAATRQAATVGALTAAAGGEVAALRIPSGDANPEDIVLAAPPGEPSTGFDDELRGGAGHDLLMGRGGNDTLFGDHDKDILIGGIGNDHLDGGLDDDAMTGGPGNDIYVVNTPNDVVNEDADAGTDGVFSSVTYTLGDNVENLALTGNALNAVNGTGNELDNWIIGNIAKNVLNGMGGDDVIAGYFGDDTVNGGAGDDTLFGGFGNDEIDGGPGVDDMHGGYGDDTFVVDSTDDVVVEEANAGTDEVLSAATYTLGDHVESLILTGVGHTNGTGNSLDNRVVGNPGDNVLLGMDGKDELSGGDGHDVLEGGDDDDILYGELGDDVLIGGAGNDWLDGGFGRDAMEGGGGNDIYIVQSKYDVVIEEANAGIDGVFSSQGYALGQNVENLTLTGSTTDHIWGTGNKLDNWITGNSGNNLLQGLAGDDIIFGADGDDVIRGNRGHDQLNGADGNDVVKGGRGNDIVEGGLNDDDLSGNRGHDELIGGHGNDTLSGGRGKDVLSGGEGDDELAGGKHGDVLNGGLGNDLLIGGRGADLFEFSGAFGQDTVQDFTPGQGDQLVISGYGSDLDTFGELAPHVTDDGVDTTVDLTAFGGGTITLLGVTGLEESDVGLFA